MIKDFEIHKLSHGYIQPLYDFFGENGQLKSEHFYPHPFSLEYLVFLIINKTRDFYCVLTIDNKVVGYGLLRGWEEGYDIPSLGIAIHRDYRGLGLGKFLMEYLHLVAKLRESKKIRLRVHKSNKVAKDMYEELGYIFREFDNEYYEGIKTL